MKPLASTVKKVFLVHGELPQAKALAEAIREAYGVAAVIPERGEAFAL